MLFVHLLDFSVKFLFDLLDNPIPLKQHFLLPFVHLIFLVDVETAELDLSFAVIIVTQEDLIFHWLISCTSLRKQHLVFLFLHIVELGPEDVRQLIHLSLQLLPVIFTACNSF